MKFLETHFEEYTNSVTKYNLHPKLEKYYEKLPNKIDDLCNLIFYGPNGVGKYSQALHVIKKYSPTELKYEKKLTIVYDKKQYYFKISDIHFEIDMSLLGCNSKLLWHEIYQQIVDILSARTNKTGIIMCKEFHSIHSELLDNFYSYIQNNNSSHINIKYILLTDHVSFIPNLILNGSEIINIPRPTKSAYSKCLNKKLASNLKLDMISNIKNLNISDEAIVPHKIICDKIINEMIQVENIKFLHFRDLLYDVFIYNLDITECVWYIITELSRQKKIKESDRTKILLKTYNFFKYYNNNYRPIYHLESFLFNLVKVIHGYK